MPRVFFAFAHVRHTGVPFKLWVMFGTYVASRSVMFERSSLLPNIEALYINSPVPPVIAEKYAQIPRPSFARFFLQKYTQEGACSMHICKFYCLILVHSITF